MELFYRIKLTNTPDGVVKLEIAHAQPSDCGAYKLVISNPNGVNAALCAVAIKRMYKFTFSDQGNRLANYIIQLL